MKAGALAAMEKLHSIVRASAADSFPQNKQKKIHTHIIRITRRGKDMTLGTTLLLSGGAVLAASLVGTIVCIIIGHGKKKRLKAYLKEWY